MKNNYLKRTFDKIYKNNLNDISFDLWMKNDFKHLKSRNQLIKTFTDYKENIIEKKINLILSMIGNSKQFKGLLFNIRTYYFNINKINVTNIKTLEIKMIKYDKYINYLNKIIFKFEINETITKLEEMKLEISKSKYYNLFDKEIKQIDRLINILNEPNIDQKFKIIETDLTLIQKNIMNNIKNKAVKYKNKEIIKTPIKPNKVVLFNKNELIQNKTDLIQKNKNKVIIKDDGKLITLIKEKNKINCIVKDYGKIKSEQQERNNYLKEEYNDLINKNIKIKPLAFFEYCEIRVLRNQRLSDEEVCEIVKYIENLKVEFLYLFKTTLDHNDDKKILEMLLNLDKLVEKKIDSYIIKEKVKKLA